MNTKKYKFIIYFITITIITTIAIQFFWNYKNYEENKRQVANEIQLSLDNAVEEYYSSLAKSDFITIIDHNYKEELSENKKLKKDRVTFNNLRISTDENISLEKRDSMMTSMKKIMIKLNSEDGSLQKKKKKKNRKLISQFTDNKKGYTLNSDGSRKEIQFFKGKKSADSLKLLKNLKPLFISFFDESLDYKKIDSLLDKQLSTKGIILNSSINHFKNDTLFHQTKDSLLDVKVISINSKSTFIKDNETFTLLYNNPGLEALKRSFFGILLSFLLALAVVSSLFYLLKIINQQKELATIKNDLISNITHEFKTPIATVSTAIEAIENFNVIDDKEKTQKYLSISSVQLKKLHQMVEKLLETATLDSEQLILKKETIDVVEMVEKLVAKHQLLTKNKELLFSSNFKPIYLNVDVFHFENVISNLIDNAVKYGGKNIEISINSILKSTEISIADDGNGINKNHQEKIFDKFYRVPKGNTHDVKGFGIGLYYSKKIIEKHKGNLSLSSIDNQTIFKINIPNE